MTGDPAEERPRSAVRGKIPASPRWRPVRDLNNEAATRLHHGEVGPVGEQLRDAVARTRVPDVDAEGLDLRARALLNLASVHEYEGDLTGALRLAEEALGAASDAIALIGDERATRTVQINGMLSRAQTLTLMDRLEDALTAVDDAEALLDSDGLDQRGLLTFSVHNARTGIFIVTGRLQDAETEAKLALAAALAENPQLSGHVYVNLGVIAQRTGDEAAALEYLKLAEQAHEYGGDAVSRQLSAENLARVAMQQGRFAEAEEGFVRAAMLAKEAGLTTRLAACRTGAAAVYLQSGNPVRAAKALRGILADLNREGGVHEKREAYGFLGDAESERGRFGAADEAYRAARDLTRSAHERCRVNLRRAEMHAEWASFTPGPRRRAERLKQAVELAVPVLLATEALRNDFAPGQTRERWSLHVAAPARELAFRLAVTLGDSELLFGLIENAAASATLEAEAVEAQLPSESLANSSALNAPVLPFPLTAQRDDDGDDDRDDDAATLPAAASGLVGDLGSTTTLRFAPPPRVVAIPGGDPVLEPWIRAAEAEYGVAVRSNVVVAAW